MVHNFINILIKLLQTTHIDNRLIVAIISFLPIVESRLGLPVGIKLGLTSSQSWFYSFLGSSLSGIVVILLLMPLLKKMSNSKKFSTVANFLNDMFEKHAKKINEKTNNSNEKNYQYKKVWAVIIFVAMPGPLTGIWAGAAVAVLLKLDYAKAIFSLIIGNFFASLLVLVFSDFLNIYLDYVIFILIISAFISIIVLVIKLLKRVKKEKLKKINTKQDI